MDGNNRWQQWMATTDGNNGQQQWMVTIDSEQ